MPDNVLRGPWGAGDDDAQRQDPAAGLDAWAAAVEHLHARVLPAAVPELPAQQLRRRGIYADWSVAA